MVEARQTAERQRSGIFERQVAWQRSRVVLGDGDVLRMAPQSYCEHLVAGRETADGFTHRFDFTGELPSEDGFAWTEDAEPNAHQDRKSPRHTGAPQARVASGDRGCPNLDEDLRR